MILKREMITGIHIDLLPGLMDNTPRYVASILYTNTGSGGQLQFIKKMEDTNLMQLMKEVSTFVNHENVLLRL